MGRETMIQADIVGAVEHAVQRLIQELPPRMIYHSVYHTRDDVLPAADRLAALEAVPDEACALLRVAAAFHDIGFVEHSFGHEAIGVRIAAETLPRFGFSPAQIDEVAGMIHATRLPQTPNTLLEQILADADLDVLGRDDFWSRNALLRAELEAHGQTMSDVDWFSSQIRFFCAHTYFTEGARRLRAPTKQRNLEALMERLDAATAAVS
jgi:uncharacterized protein